ncbi:hypothetical protein DFH08DRAFT_997845 [Mycena albidolilacea]|uniref:Uncharacterized protein n=1 Tax=Mycena albidolilacea TaxID=1033008 RepID=A0AAD6YWG2_9AGAR|nr:hypothetical protein DFH08DRAFT_997845 [Mycena albidolilacea]
MAARWFRGRLPVPTSREKLHLFWGPLYHQWFQVFPEHAGLNLPLPGDESGRKLTDEETVVLGAAIQSRKKASHPPPSTIRCTNTYPDAQKLENWFRYQSKKIGNAGVANSAKLGAMVDVLFDLKPKSKKRVHQAIEVFQRRNRELIKDALTNAGYDKLLERDDDEDDWADEAGGSDAGRAKAHKAQRMRVEKEKEELRVAELREEEAKKEKEKTPAQLQEHVGGVLAKAHGAVYEGARWVGMTLVRGANPRMGGALSMKIICHGTTPAGNDFEDSCVDFDQNVVEAFEGFLQQVFKECLARALEVKTLDTSDASRPATVIQAPAPPPTAPAAKAKPKAKRAKKKASAAAPATATATPVMVTAAAAAPPPAPVVEPPRIAPNSNGPSVPTNGQTPDDIDTGGDFDIGGDFATGGDFDGANGSGPGEQASEGGGATGEPTMAPLINPRLLDLDLLQRRPLPTPAFCGAGAVPSTPLFRLSPLLDGLGNHAPASAGPRPVSGLPPFTPQPSATQLALMGNTAPSLPVTHVAPTPVTPVAPTPVTPVVPTPVTPVAPTPVMPVASTPPPAVPTPLLRATMFFLDSRPSTQPLQPPVGQAKKTIVGRKAPPSKKSASKTIPRKAAENEVAAKTARDAAAEKDAVQKKRGKPLKQAPTLADVTNEKDSAATHAYSITNNNRTRARQAAAAAKAAEEAEAEKACAAQIAKGWMPGREEGTVVLLRARKPRAHPDGTLPPRVVEVAARRLDACEKALLERAAAEKRKAAAAPSSSKAPSRKKFLSLAALLNQRDNSPTSGPHVIVLNGPVDSQRLNDARIRADQHHNELLNAQNATLDAIVDLTQEMKGLREDTRASRAGETSRTAEILAGIVAQRP